MHAELQPLSVSAELILRIGLEAVYSSMALKVGVRAHCQKVGVRTPGPPQDRRQEGMMRGREVRGSPSPLAWPGPRALEGRIAQNDHRRRDAGADNCSESGRVSPCSPRRRADALPRRRRRGAADQKTTGRSTRRVNVISG